MKNLFLMAFLFFGCKSVSEIPQPLYPNGFTFEVPCDEHGGHIQTIVSSELVYVYTIEGDDGSSVKAPENTIKGVIELFKAPAMPTEQSKVRRKCGGYF